MARGFVLACVVLLAVYLLAGVVVFHRHPANALFGAFLLVLLHWFNETWHNYGHFTAARRTGFPMDGVRLGTALLVFGTSIYPPDEQELSASVHIQRALGGPIANAILTAVGVVAILVLTVLSSHFVWVAIVFTIENLLVFTVGNFLPFGFNDGSTLLHWMRRR
ncbi:MAG: hypothetical protein QOK05_1811 [Chloroflexota bacterium]|nr:hypothetical protein [Chloroflexota bacterium]